MTALLSTNEIDTARRLAKPRFTFAGTLRNGDAFYSNDQGYAVEKDKMYIVEPTPDEMKEILLLHRSWNCGQTGREDGADDLAPARGISIGILAIAALWLVIGLVIYFTFI